MVTLSALHAATPSLESPAPAVLTDPFPWNSTCRTLMLLAADERPISTSATESLASTILKPNPEFQAPGPPPVTPSNSQSLVAKASPAEKTACPSPKALDQPVEVP